LHVPPGFLDGARTASISGGTLMYVSDCCMWFACCFCAVACLRHLTYIHVAPAAMRIRIISVFWQAFKPLRGLHHRKASHCTLACTCMHSMACMDSRTRPGVSSSWFRMILCAYCQGTCNNVVVADTP
jgi:hypothetical protein